MALNWAGAGLGAMSGGAMTGFNPLGIAGGAALGLFSGGGDNGGGGGQMSLMDMIGPMIEKYSYQPQYTAQTESSLFDLFQRMTGQGAYAGKGNGDVSAIPFDVGLPTTNLYDSLTRGIKEDYLGLPGAGEGGKIADLRAYYNQAGVPEAALNAERGAYQDMNNSLLDKAALINESQKDRLMNVLNMGNTSGQNLYSQNLAQQRFNTGLASNAMAMDYNLSNAISESNNGALDSLFGSVGTSGGTGASILSSLTGLLGQKMGGGTQVGYSTDPTKNTYNQYTGAKNATAKLI